VTLADRIICVSRFTAQEAMSLLGVATSKLEVVHNGCDFHPSETPPKEQAPDFQVPERFYLFVGSLEPGKNLALLKKVYSLADEARRRLPALLIAGARWLGVAGEGTPPPGWRYLGRPPDDVLVYLYRRALALVFPSKYEGFGLPVAEAMSLGCPVICSRTASLPEVGGNAVCYAEMDPASYLGAMERVAQDGSFRRELQERGLGQAAQFSWRRCASETVRVYQSTL
jgi:alpha-1,3-rhamnosyl/mannosyltransferase